MKFEEYCTGKNAEERLYDKTNQFTCIQYVLPHTINYQHVSIAFATIIRVDLQEY